MGQQSIIPLKLNLDQPKEGYRSLQYTVDLTNKAAVVDLIPMALQNQLSQIPTVFVDNADNSFPIRLTMEGTLQRIVVPANSQGYISLLLPKSPRLGFSCDVSLAALNVNFLNFFVEEMIWLAGAQVTNSEIKSVVPFANAVPIASGAVANITTIQLPPGTYEVMGTGACFPNGANMTSLTVAIGLTSATLPPVLTDTSGNFELSVAFSVSNTTIANISPFRIVNPGPGNLPVYLMASPTFTGGACSAWGTLRAVRQIV